MDGMYVSFLPSARRIIRKNFKPILTHIIRDMNEKLTMKINKHETL